MSRLAIKGHSTRGSEVIALLEMLGGINSHNLYGDESYAYYTIDSDKEIKGGIYVFGDEDLLSFTLEEFEEKFPYKVGDKVNYVKYDDEYPSVYTIQKMWWSGVTIIYILDTNGFSALTKDLQPYKEETMEDKSNLLQQLKQYFDSTPREVIEKEWHEYDKYNEIAPKVNEYLEFINNIRQPKYPKTYIECAKMLNCFSAALIDGYKSELLDKFQQLLICRDAYWKIAGDWKSDWTKADERKYCIVNTEGDITKWVQKTTNKILAFPTEEMCDAFYANFKELIETCKELL